MTQGSGGLEARVDRLEWDMDRVAQTIAGGMQGMASDIKEMSKDMKELAPHTESIRQIRLEFERRDEEMAKRDAMFERLATSLTEAIKQINFWRGTQFVVVLFAGIVFTVITDNINGRLLAIKGEVSRVEGSASADRSRIERRIDKLEGAK